MLKEIENSLTEEHIVLFNLFKKILDNSHSSLPTIAIAAHELGIKRNYVLLRYGNQLFPLINPKLEIKNNNSRNSVDF